MKGFFGLSVLLAVVLSVFATSVQLQRPEDESSYQEGNADLTVHHGSRMKRSPIDPVVAPLLIGKSFLYGALIGPKLFHRPRYYHHYRPHGWGYSGHFGGHHGGHGGHHGGHYGGHHGGYGWGWGW